MASLPDAKELEGRKDKDSSDPAPQSRDFFWDSITLYIVGAILGLTAIDVVSEFLRGSDVRCYQPNETESSVLSSVQDYVNEFCTGYLPTLQFLPSFIAVHAIAILVPHYVWLNAFGADMDFFFKHVWKLERNRQHDTGDYPPDNYVISREMERAFCTKYGRPNGMYWWYISKVILQLFLTLVGMVLVPLVVFKFDEQNVTFQCPASERDARGDSWPLPDRETVMCVFSPINLLRRIWAVYLFLLGLAVLFMVINVLQLLKWHTTELGFNDCANFSFQTGMSYHYFHPQVVSKVLPKNFATPFHPNNRYWFRTAMDFLRYPFSPYNIESDYEFLMVKLFRTDGGLAYIMKEVHVLRLLREMNKTDLSKLHLYRLDVAGSSDATSDFIRADTGWNLPKFASYNHVPALDEKVLVMPQTFRGLVMGCALRCEGGYDYKPKIVSFAQDRLNLANAQLELAGKLKGDRQDRREEEQQQTAVGYQAKAKEYKSEADRLKKYRTLLNSMRSELAPKKQDLEVAKATLKEILEFESDAASARDKVQSTAVVRKRKVKDTNIEQQQQYDEEGKSMEGKITEAGSGGASPTMTQQQLSLPDTSALLSELADTAAHLQLEVLQLEKRIKEAQDVDDTHQKNEVSLVKKLETLQTDQQILAYKQQVVAKAQGNSELLRIALQKSGPALVSALVIGFDMESEGLPTALARIFRRVGFINFSSHHADYENPLMVTSRSYYIFNATLPFDILTRVGIDGNDKPTVFEEMMEIWYRSYKQTSMSGDKKVSNYVVIGPVSDGMHIATVNRMLSQYELYLSHHAIIMTIQPQKVGGKNMIFKEYTPPDDGYVEISRNVKMDGGTRNWQGAAGSADGDRSSNSPFTIDLGSTDMQFSFRLYKGCRF